MRTLTQLLKKRKDDYLAYNNSTFANIVHELPKFQNEDGDNKKWWTKQRGYNSTEYSKSSKEYYLRKISRGKPDPIVIADHESSPPPADPFKTTHVTKPPKPSG